MSHETEQEKFCDDIWLRIKMRDTTQIHHLQGNRQTLLTDHRKFLGTRLSVFDALPFAEDFYQKFRHTPSAVIRLGTQALIAVTFTWDQPSSQLESHTDGRIVNELVSLEHDGFTPLGTVAYRDGAVINRHVLRDKTKYYHGQVSRSHIVVGTTAVGFAVTDLGSANGTDVAVEYGLSGPAESSGTNDEKLYVPTQEEWRKIPTVPGVPQERGLA